MYEFLCHKVVKDNDFDVCQTKTFELEKETEPFTYFRFVLDEEYPTCKKCMLVNQIELYGQTLRTGFEYSSDGSNDDDSVSIIGRIKENEV